MSRKTKSWVLIAAVLYLVVLWSAYRWGKSQRRPHGSVPDRIESDAKAKAAPPKSPEFPLPPTAESRLDGGGTAFIAARYDATRVAFLVTNGTERRFAEPGAGNGEATFHKIPAPEKPSAELAGMQELWEPESFARLPEVVKQMSGEDDKQWTLQVSPELTIPVALERPVIIPSGCSLGAGFLAAVPRAQQAAYAASSQEYYVIRRAPAQLANPVRSSRNISPQRDWESTPEFQKQLAALLGARMKQELSRIDATLRVNAQNPGESERAGPAAQVRARPKEWPRLDLRLERDEGKLDYDVRAFRLTPDGVPRLFVRARWTLEGTPVFLMSAWFRESLEAKTSRTEARPVLLSADSSWSTKLRDGEALEDLGSTLDFQRVLSEFDADHDGWAELLVYTTSSDDGRASASIALYLYTDLGLVPLKASLTRDLSSPASCLQSQ